MRFLTPTSLVVALSTAIASAYAQAPPPQNSKPAKPAKNITLSGCVEPDAGGRDQMKLTDKSGKVYRLSGINVREYLGRPVQLDGGIVIKGLQIKGGLSPNPNVAAQAGAMDPGRAAVATATSNSTTGNVDVQEFRVKAVRPAAGSCQ